MTAATAGGIVRPPLNVTVLLDGDVEHTVKMTYGLFQDLQRLVPDPAALVDTILADVHTREYVLRRCLTPLRKIITNMEKELIPAEEVLLDDPDEINKLLQWVAGHLLYFFATSAGGLRQLRALFQGEKSNEADQPAPSTNGSAS